MSILLLKKICHFVVNKTNLVITNLSIYLEKIWINFISVIIAISLIISLEIAFDLNQANAMPNETTYVAQKENSGQRDITSMEHFIRQTSELVSGLAKQAKRVNIQNQTQNFNSNVDGEYLRTLSNSYKEKKIAFLSSNFWENNPEAFSNIQNYKPEQILVLFKINTSLYNEVNSFLRQVQETENQTLSEDDLNDLWYELTMRSTINSNIIPNFHLFDDFDRNDFIQFNFDPETNPTFYQLLLSKSLYLEQEKILYQIFPEKIKKTLDKTFVSLMNIKLTESIEQRGIHNPELENRNRKLKIESYQKFNKEKLKLQVLLNELETRLEEFIVFKTYILTKYDNPKALEFSNKFLSDNDKENLINIQAEIKLPIKLNTERDQILLEKVKVLNDKKRASTLQSAEALEDENRLLKDFAKINSEQPVVFLALEPKLETGKKRAGQFVTPITEKKLIKSLEIRQKQIEFRQPDKTSNKLAIVPVNRSK